jgi:hypothetical protein
MDLCGMRLFSHNYARTRGSQPDKMSAVQLSYTKAAFFDGVRLGQLEPDCTKPSLGAKSTIDSCFCYAGYAALNGGAGG